jgi:hypothetical protein
MKKIMAQYASTILSGCALIFISILKPWLGSPKAPKELLKNK